MALPEFVTENPKRSVLAAGIAAGIVGLLLLVLAMGTTPTADAGALKKELNEELTSQQTGLTDDYNTLLHDVSSIDTDRLARDDAAGRDLALGLAATSGSGLGLGAQQASLQAQFDYLSSDSRVVTQFLPEWLSATTAAGPSFYELGSFDVQLTRMAGLTYHYTAVAKLDPISTGGEESKADSEFVLLRYTTAADGSLDSVEASRASSDSREALAGPTDDQTTDTTPTDDASATPEATTESDDS